ncbi:MAG: DUF4293 domain-containing protein [Bacteroidetes bacterium]|nr:DUF4293 domain-containing protein [Bacteroidota bacterium]
MIQRLQTVYLGMIVVILVLLCTMEIIDYMPVVTDGTGLQYKLNLFYFNKFEKGVLVESKLQIGLIILTSIAIGLSSFVIGMFKDRKKQIKFAWINMGVLVALVVAFLVKAMLYIGDFQSENMRLLSIIGLSILFFTLYLNLRSIMLIKRDEELVRSADRIR